MLIVYAYDLVEDFNPDDGNFKTNGIIEPGRIVAIDPYKVSSVEEVIFDCEVPDDIVVSKINMDSGDEYNVKMDVYKIVEHLKEFSSENTIDLTDL